MNAEYRGKMPLLHITQGCPAADSQARYTAKLILLLVLAELNSYKTSIPICCKLNRYTLLILYHFMYSNPISNLWFREAISGFDQTKINGIRV